MVRRWLFAAMSISLYVVVLSLRASVHYGNYHRMLAAVGPPVSYVTTAHSDSSVKWREVILSAAVVLS